MSWVKSGRSHELPLLTLYYELEVRFNLLNNYIMALIKQFSIKSTNEIVEKLIPLTKEEKERWNSINNRMSYLRKHPEEIEKLPQVTSELLNKWRTECGMDD